ncbi:peptidase M28-like protein [Naumannella halotolerans]|uniref:Peptidase M28-like protein n=1 Tax=Naumannella halotolerans TaxID=993414 RepID=A0A4R7J151_9ACTN|nr:peptidase M28-like protein [Naumannella halotolerans]
MTSSATTTWQHGCRAAVVSAATAVVLTSGVAFGPDASAAPVDPYEFAAAVDREAISDHLETFQQIADENEGNRADGSPGGVASADYIVQVLTEAGYAVEVQEFTTESGSESENIIASTPTGRDDNVAVFGAHYDSVPEGAGMNDNASGTAALLQVATELIATEPLNNQVRFTFWGAEETGLEGSAAYVDSLTDAELESLIVYYNYDMIGSPNYLIGVEDGKADSYNGAPLTEGSAAAMDLQTDYFDSIEQPWQPSEMCCTDYNPFHDAGIPIGGLYTGGREAPKTDEEYEKFGGVAGEFPDPNYHTAGDDLANVSLEAIDINTGVIAFAAASLGASSESINGIAPTEPTTSPSGSPSSSGSVPPSTSPSTPTSPPSSPPTTSSPPTSSSTSPEPSATPTPVRSTAPTTPSPEPVPDRKPFSGSMAETGAPALAVIGAGALAALTAGTLLLRRRP